jgi:hypothetical protein
VAISFQNLEVKYGRELLDFDPRQYTWYDRFLLLGERLPRQGEILLWFPDRVPLREQMRLDSIAVQYVLHLCGWPPECDRIPDEIYCPLSDKAALAYLAGKPNLTVTQPIWWREFHIIGRALPVII